MIEKEKLVLNAGQYFGDWGILENKTRTSSIYAIEDTELFSLSSDYFKMTFGRCMIRSETEKKTLLMNTIRPFYDISKSKFNVLYKSMVFIFLSKNEHVYLEGNFAESFFIIYDGSFKLLKKNLTSKNNKDDFNTSDFNKHHTVMKMGRGDLSGLEASINFVDYNNENDFNKFNNKHNLNNLDNHINLPKYNYSLIAEKDYNVVISINPKFFGDELREKVLNFLSPIYEQKESILNSIIQKHLGLKNKMKLIFREEIIKQLSRNSKAVIHKHIDDTIDSGVLKKIKYPNYNNNQLKSYNFKMTSNSSTSKEIDFSMYHMSSTHKEGNYSTLNISNIKNSNDKNFQSLSLNISQNDYNIKFNPDTDYKKIKKFILYSSAKEIDFSDSNVKNINDEKQINLIKDKNSEKINSKFKINRKNSIFDINPENKSIISNREFSDLVNNQNINLNKQTSKNNFMRNARSNLLPTKLDKLFNIKGNESIESKINLINKKEAIKEKVKINLTKLKFANKYISQSINQWKKINQTNQNDYDSGKYDLPLISNIKIKLKK